MEVFIAAFALVFIAMFVMAIGVLFFNAPASQTSCSTDPTKSQPGDEDGKRCASGEAGLCPFEDNTGAIKMANMTKINNQTYLSQDK